MEASISVAQRWVSSPTVKFFRTPPWYSAGHLWAVPSAFASPLSHSGAVPQKRNHNSHLPNCNFSVAKKVKQKQQMPRVKLILTVYFISLSTSRVSFQHVIDRNHHFRRACALHTCTPLRSDQPRGRARPPRGWRCLQFTGVLIASPRESCPPSAFA